MKTNTFIKNMFFVLALSMAIVVPSYGMYNLFDGSWFEIKKIKVEKNEWFHAIYKNDYVQIENWLTQPYFYELQVSIDEKSSMDRSEQTGLMIAAELGCIEIVNLLLAAGANVHEKDKFGSTVLMWAASCRAKFSWHYSHKEMIKSREIIKLLLEAGVDVNEKNKYGSTALMFVDSYDITRILIEHGADHTPKNILNRTALDNARMMNYSLDAYGIDYDRIVQFLEIIDFIDKGDSTSRSPSQSFDQNIFNDARESLIKKSLYLQEIKDKKQNVHNVIKNLKIGIKK